VTDEQPRFDSVVILADASANWRIAGLRQLERLVLALNEFAETTGYQEQVAVHVFWEPKIPFSERWLPDNSRFVRIRPMGSMVSLESVAYVFTTRLFVVRNGLREFFQSAPAVKLDPPIELSPENWQELSDRCETAGRSGTQPEEEGGWRVLGKVDDIAAAERQLLSRSGKPQDGMVSKFINRPISRLITHFLLQHSIGPAAWTLSIFVLPLLTLVFFLRGGYADFVIGTVLYQFHSILDGCDGEIARAKYLESKKGGRIDDLCDIAGSFLFLIGLGFGLYDAHRFAPDSFLYAAEGLLCAALIGANEWLLRRPKAEVGQESGSLTQTLYPRHRDLIQNSGLMFLGENFVRFLIQLTKRDVGILFFVCLALAGLPQWILHIWTGATIVIVSLTAIDWLRTRADARRIVSP
jgi:hypothetical protein